MLIVTRKIKGLYEDIQRKIFYMIPEKWEKVCLYSSVMDRIDGKRTGELFFYYFPKSLIKRNPINVYEIPQRFNLDEQEYSKLVNNLYEKIVELRDECKKSDAKSTAWTNMTITIKGINFKVEYGYEDLNSSKFSSYDRHIIWRYNNLGITENQLNKKDRSIILDYKLGEKSISRKENYETGIYIKNIKNIVDYNTENYKETQNIGYIIENENKTKNVNQILFFADNKK